MGIPISAGYFKAQVKNLYKKKSMKPAIFCVRSTILQFSTWHMPRRMINLID